MTDGKLTMTGKLETKKIRGEPHKLPLWKRIRRKIASIRLHHKIQSGQAPRGRTSESD